jgi:hypothetical protein
MDLSLEMQEDVTQCASSTDSAHGQRRGSKNQRRTVLSHGGADEQPTRRFGRYSASKQDFLPCEKLCP